ncbi:uncharacterized protein CELE_F08B4.8 [Caenorhabditis elegans]|uniref:Secreted protein n=1 Tax=Caenorhabditis elegans TaxID=6239 RepID=X5LV29_CAEEL|nr:Secreted protein [Caenorhabditis elegans]CDO41065.1 Secreted protein [Caenorhabditis elegans]|eukprot:NP_001294027.1 Uncharacterized protein CELE_F08B4.8 [Caenorhabditis elegans]
MKISSHLNNNSTNRLHSSLAQIFMQPINVMLAVLLALASFAQGGRSVAPAGAVTEPTVTQAVPEGSGLSSDVTDRPNIDSTDVVSNATSVEDLLGSSTNANNTGTFNSRTFVIAPMMILALVQ